MAEGAHSANSARYGEEPHELTVMVAKPEQVQNKNKKPADRQSSSQLQKQQQQQQQAPTSFLPYMMWKLDMNSRLDRQYSTLYGAPLSQRCITYFGFFFLFLVWGAVVAFSVGSIYLWQRFVHEPCEQNLTYWLVVTGIAALTHLTASNLLACSGARPNRPRQVWDFLMFWFAFCTCIWGAVMVYSIDRSSYYCPRPVFEYMWSLYIVIWICWGIMFLYSCVVAIMFFRS